MSENRYWSVEDCRWVKLPTREEVEAAAVAPTLHPSLPAQRVDEPVEEPVDA